MAIRQPLIELFHGHQQGLGLLVLATGFLGQAGDALFNRIEVSQHQLGFNGFGIAHRINIVINMGDVVIIKAPQHMDDGIDFPDIGEELVAQPLTLGGPANKTGDIHKLKLGRDHLL